MKYIFKKTTKTETVATKKHIIFVLSLLVSVPLMVIATMAFLLYLYATRFATGLPLASVVISASEQITRPAVIDSKTADQYFPEARLFIPYNKDLPQYTYRWNANVQELIISTRESFSRNARQVFAAQSIELVLERTRHLQACQRGIILGYSTLQELPEQYSLDQTIKLANSRLLNVYINKNCPDFKLGSELNYIKTITPF